MGKAKANDIKELKQEVKMVGLLKFPCSFM